jgi:hypothetical protein
MPASLLTRPSKAVQEAENVAVNRDSAVMGLAGAFLFYAKKITPPPFTGKEVTFIGRPVSHDIRQR